MRARAIETTIASGGYTLGLPVTIDGSSGCGYGLDPSSTARAGSQSVPRKSNPWVSNLSLRSDHCATAMTNGRTTKMTKGMIVRAARAMPWVVKASVVTGRGSSRSRCLAKGVRSRTLHAEIKQ